MKTGRIILSIAVMVLIVWGATPASAAKEPAGEASSQDTREMFDAVVDKLDLGGDALVYFNIDGLISEFVDGLLAAIPQIPQKPGSPNSKGIVERADAFLGNIGVYDTQAYGFSSIPMEGGADGYVQKSFLKIEEKHPRPLLWSIAGQPAPIEGLEYMPKDTVLMWGGRMKPALVLKLINKAALEVGGMNTRKALDRQFANIKKSLGFDVVSACNTLQEEIVFGIQLSDTEKVNITGDTNNPVKIGAPSFLLVAKTGKEGLMDQLLKLEQNNVVDFEKVEIDGKLKMLMMPAFEASPVPLRICFYQGEEYFLAASTQKLLKETLEIVETGEGLVNSDKFQRLMEDMPELYSSVSYLSKRYMGSMLDMQRQMSEMAPGPNVDKAMAKLYGKFAEGDVLGVGVACDDGFYSVTKAPYGGQQVLKSFMMMPVGMMAGIAVPSFMEARQSSQKNVMVNNLRQIDAAKEQWAMENNKSLGAEPGAEDIGVYIKGGMPSFPQGSRYEIKPIGEDPVIILPSGEKVGLP